MKTSTKTFNVKGKITRAQLNSTGFGCRINYPTNTNKWNGYLRVSYVRVRVEYVLSDYTVKVDAVDGYNGEPFDVTLRVSNKNLTRYNPSLTLTVPIGFTYNKYEGTGRVTKVNNTTYRWEPNVGGSGSSNVTLSFTPSVTYPSGSGVFTGTFTLSESLNGANATKTISIREKPQTSEETGTGEKGDSIDENSSKYNEILSVIEEEIFALDIDFNSVDWDNEEVNIFIWLDTGDWYSFNNEVFDSQCSTIMTCFCIVKTDKVVGITLEFLLSWRIWILMAN